ncbi:hypothetical protein FGK63_15190 [Ruegeria sediminis]|uniref:Uncharacterized protein n=1 Tax=Ruegeria sediminis TaxID=2583820 RepID=A0ABY2WW18_9RHOB|nr:hypothetical protein [Ruegeria sediminis]TMV06487.1 hypothetical protein FGK63_15190 [Ruegeria sediminis]
MNPNRMIDRFVRIAIRTLVNRGIDKGFDLAEGMSRKHENEAGQSGSARSPQQDADAVKHQKQKFQQAQRLTRQMRRFVKF